jgi:hypothetical protein
MNEQEWIAQLNALQDEIRHAMAALGEDALQSFEESLWRQEVLCHGLQALRRSAPAPSPTTEASQELRSAAGSLREVTRTYQEAVQQASASTALLRLICCTHKHTTGREDLLPTGTRCSIEV